MYGMVEARGIEELGQNLYSLRLVVGDSSDAGDVLQTLVVDMGLAVSANRDDDSTVELVARGAWQQVVVVLATIAEDRGLFHLPANKVIEKIVLR